MKMHHTPWLMRLALLVVLFVMSRNCHAQRAPQGFFLLQGVDKSNVRDSALRDSNIAGLSIRVSWDSIDKGTNFDWDWLDSQVNRARALRKPYMIRLMAGVSHHL